MDQDSQNTAGPGSPAGRPDPSILTDRLTLAPWTEADLPDVAALNADPEVMRHFPSVLTPAETAEHVGRWADRLARSGFGMLCARERAGGAFVGIIGAQWIPYEADFGPAVEIGWRLARRHWGKGYATEGGAASAARVFALTDQPRVIAVTTLPNTASMAVMRRIGMREIGRFSHPLVPADSPLNPHVLYGLERPAG